MKFDNLLSRRPGTAMHRRGILKLGAAALAGAALPGGLFGGSARTAGSGPSARPEDMIAPRALSLHNTHTGEDLSETFWRDGSPVASALERINHVLRDHYSGKVELIDIRLLHLLHRLKTAAGAARPFHVISGYRSPETNERLRRKGGVASQSLHMFGQAIDIRLPGCPLAELKRLALSLRGGGVGYYPQSEFVHVDVGRVRIW